MGDKGESVSKFDAFIERIPLLDGGGRRRLTAGAIVVLTVLLASPELSGWIVNAVETKVASVSLFLAAGALLIYATGVIVELIGEVFLARAVANAAWSYIAAAQFLREQRWHRLAKQLAWLPIVVVWGTPRAIAYFVLGLFGGSRWRMRLAPRLSQQARSFYEELPTAVRGALEHTLSNKADFGRKAVIDELRAPASRAWRTNCST